MDEIRLSGIIGALSYALDITEGEPPGHATRSCAIGMRLAGALGLSPEERSDLFYALLLKDAGCSANANRVAMMLHSDDRAAKASLKLVDWTSRRAGLSWMWRNAAPGASTRRRLEVLRSVSTQPDATRELTETRCHRGAAIASMLFLSDRTALAIEHLDEHWDGSGMPAGRRGEEIPIAGRILCLAQTIEVFSRTEGPEASRRVAQRRRGSWFDPQLVDTFLALSRDGAFWAEIDRSDVSEWEPEDHILHADEQRLDCIAQAFAQVIDAKSPFTARHSERVAQIADGIAVALGFGSSERRRLHRAAALHDIGKLAISSRILDKPGRLTEEEFAVVRTHPTHTLQIVSRIPCFSELAALAANHHEKLDGSGYPRGLRAEELDLPMRVLTVADIFEALTAERPYRGLLPVEEALRIIAADVPQKLDGDVVAGLERYVCSGSSSYRLEAA